MAWQTPKLNWQPAEPLTENDMNRIEGNIQHIYDNFVKLVDYEDSDVLAKIKNVDGSGSGLDADKLDGYHASSFVKTSDYEDADVLAKIKNVDGSGSGLDADMVDGKHASDFAVIDNSTIVIFPHVTTLLGTLNVTVEHSTSWQYLSVGSFSEFGRQSVIDTGNGTYTIYQPIPLKIYLHIYAEGGVSSYTYYAYLAILYDGTTVYTTPTYSASDNTYEHYIEVDDILARIKNAGKTIADGKTLEVRLYYKIDREISNKNYTVDASFAETGTLVYGTI